jgi:hypothetical protein
MPSRASHLRMKALLRYTTALRGAYFIAWSASYAIVSFNAVHRLDFSLYFEWLVLAWTFHGGEMVGAAWLLSIVAFLPLAGVAVFLARRRGRQSPVRADVVSN